ncbi:MAG TPA: hypothetical protein VG963_01085 [Polyangiaceae bacterium]|nr:hypothetical protein [Polyangiaceae bacterium]
MDLGLINMHGRIYDPMLAEFLTPDPLMSNPSGHGINAFSYVERRDGGDDVRGDYPAFRRVRAAVG